MRDLGVLRRRLGPVLVAAVMLAMVPGQALAATFAISGTIVSANEANRTFVIVTSDVIGKEQPITVDMSRISRQFRAQDVGSPISLLVESRDSNTYLAVGLISEGSYVDRETLGTREEFETKSSSIQAHVGNTPEDDEALAKQHRDSNLRQQEDDDESNESDDDD